MHRGQIESLKRAEKEAAARVLAASQAEPFDPVRHRAAVLEWQSARIALRSVGITPRDAGPTTVPATRAASRKRKSLPDQSGEE